MFLLGGAHDGVPGPVVYSASDLATAAACEFAVLRTLDVKLGRTDPLDLPADAMLDRAARLGDRYEEQVLAQHLARFGPWDPARGRGVACIERPEQGMHADRTTLEAKHAETLDVLRTGADVVFQAGFFDGRFGGWADFLVREPDGSPAVGGPSGRGPVYAVHDTKLARHAKVTAVLQLAAYGDQLLASGVAVSPLVHLVLGDRTVTDHRLVDLLPVYRDRRAHLERLLDDHVAGGLPVRWGQEQVRACGRCAVCAPEVEQHRDVLLVAGMRTTQRVRLHQAGVTTIEALATGDGPVEGIGGATLERLRAQARLQVEQDEAAAGAGPGATDAAPVLFEIVAPEVVAALPAPDAGDLFFDFEGDPLWSEPGSTDWGLEYLFGVVEQPRPDAPADEAPVFRPFWAHDRAQEKQALLDFLAYVEERRRQYPQMHVYHYASYEKTALLRLAGRHGVGEEAVDQLLRAGVLVDLYATVRGALRTGQRSYSLKKLEPLYMDVGRTGDVTTAGDSILEYVEACAQRDDGDLDGWHERLAQIGEYNRYDCLSTLGLRDWLREQAGVAGALVAGGDVDADGEGDATADGDGAVAAGGGPAPVQTDVDDAPEHDPLVETLTTFATPGSGLLVDRTADQHAAALLAAAVGYHWRENKPFWWGHYDRLVSDPADWAERRSTFLPEHVEVVTPWHTPPGRRTLMRTLRLTGRLEPGSDLRAGTEVYALYDEPVPGCAERSTDGLRGWTANVTVLEVTAEGDRTAVRDVLLVADRLRTKDAAHDALPMALAPGPPPPTGGIATAVRAIAEDVAARLPDLPPQPALDLLRRRPPRTRSGGLPPVEGDRYDDAITAAVLDLDGSYLAVQGPPGTGKTYTGARVVRRLVELGWRVGVVAQSHAVVENMLTGIAEAGVPGSAIGKKASGDLTVEVPWQRFKDSQFQQFYDAQDAGLVVGGTVWDLTNPGRLPAGGLDLLVVDEAGQFSLANTVAVSGAATNLLLLGDPQQLPQVSQGRHPEPVDRSALGWLTDGHDTLPDHLGYFLAHTWRMHPDLCAVVSRLSYDNRLTSTPRTARRSLDGVEPGLRCVLVEHAGNAVSSTEEADEVVAQVRGLVGRRWQDPDAGVDRPLEPSDVVVVAAYNAQVWTVRRALDAAGLRGVRVGTVDRFQGQQAPVVLVTTAASSPQDVPRGMEFLLNRNRINVAVSRGQWLAVLVRGAGLTDYLPGHPDGVEELGAFLGLCDGGGTPVEG